MRLKSFQNYVAYLAACLVITFMGAYLIGCPMYVQVNGKAYKVQIGQP